MGLEDLQRSVQYEIDDLTLDVGQCRLTRGGQPLALTKLNFLVLRCLAEVAPNVVTHAQLANAVWGERRIITHENLGKRIMLLRQMLGDSAETPRYIEAVRGMGYRLVANVRRIESATAASTAQTPAFVSLPTSPPAVFRAKRRAGLVAVLAVVIAVAAVAWLGGSDQRVSTAPSVVRSIAVLPFADRSPNGDHEYLSFGVADGISSALAGIPQLRVVGHTSALALVRRTTSPAELGSRLEVTHVVEGWVHSDGNRVRIAANVVDAASGKRVWDAEFADDEGNVFALQNEIAKRLVADLQLAASPTLSDRAPQPDVYAAYLQARHIHRNLIASSLPRARSLLEEAIAKDPDYFPARRELVASYNILMGARLLERERARDLLRRTIDDAASRWPERVEIEFWRGWYALTLDNDLATAAHHFQRSLEEPVNLDTLPVLVDFAMLMNRLDQAIVIGEYLLERDPICFFCYHNLMVAYYRAERYDKVRELYAATEALGFEHPTLKLRDALALLELKEGEEALRRLDSIDDWSGIPRDQRLLTYSMTYWLLQRRAEYDTALSELHELAPMSAAAVHAFAGDLAAAFAIFNAQQSLPPQLFDGRIGDRMRRYERWPELAAKAELWPHDQREDIAFDIASLR